MVLGRSVLQRDAGDAAELAQLCDLGPHLLQELIGRAGARVQRREVYA